MSVSHDTILKAIWPDFESSGYISKDMSLSQTDTEKLVNVMSERKMNCNSCGRGDEQSYLFSASLLGKSLVSIFIFCRCGYRIGTISRASLNPVRQERKATQLTF